MQLELRFVTAEEAAKWPEGTWYLYARIRPEGEISYGGTTEVGRTKDNVRFWTELGMNRFARLPDALPEVERNG